MGIRWFWLLLYIAAPCLPAAALFHDAPFLAEEPGLAATFVAGLFACTWLCLQVVLAARPRFLDRAFGLDRVLRFHGTMGLGLLLFGAIHVGLVEEWIGDGSESAMRRLGGIGWASLLALSALAVLFLGTAAADRVQPLRRLRRTLALRLRLNFDRARLAHNLTIGALTLVAAHVLMLSPGEPLPTFKLVVGALYGVAAAAYLRHKVFAPLKRRRRPWTLESVEHESPDLCSLVLRAPVGYAVKRDPGQFVFLRLRDPAVPEEEHPFTVASSALEPERLRITVRAAGDYTRALPGVTPGARAEVDGPYGRFTYRRLPPETPLVLLAAGIGVTPFLAMLRTLRVEQPGRAVMLVWGARTSTDLVAAEELLAMQRDMPGLVVVPVLSRGANSEALHGHIDGALIRAMVTGSLAPGTSSPGPAAVFFVCGPPGFLRDAVRHLRAAGVPRRRILAERFAL